MSYLARCLSSGTARVVLTAALWLGITIGFTSLPSALRWPARVLWLGCPAYVLLLAIKSIRHARFRPRPLIFSLILGGLMIALVHVMCGVFMRIMSTRDDRLAMRGEITLRQSSRDEIRRSIEGKEGANFHPVIGWVPRPGRRTSLYSINKQGVRATHEYPPRAADESRRVLCMGDSFTIGIAVADDQTYPAHAEQILPGSEWLNFGNPGSCLTQAYLRYTEDARKLGGKHVIIGFMTNDAQRTVNCFRPFANPEAGITLTKPFAQLINGDLVIQPNPYPSTDDYRRLLADERGELKKLLRLDYLTWGRTDSQSFRESPIMRTFSFACDRFKIGVQLTALSKGSIDLRNAFKDLAADDLYGPEFWDPASRGFQTVCALFDKFYADVIQDGRIPLIVIIPGPNDIEDYRQNQPRQYSALLRHLKSRDYRCIDFLDTLVTKYKDDLGENALFVERHYQGHVNQTLAAVIIKALPSAP